MRLPLWLRWRSNAELDEEIRAHLELEIEENLARGMSPEEARKAARRQFGNVVHVKEEARSADALYWVADRVRNVRYATRRLARSPAFTAAGVLTLALGIGAMAIVFSLAEPLLNRSLAVEEPDDLVILRLSDPAQDRYPHRVPTELFYRMAADSRTISGVLAYVGRLAGGMDLDLRVDGQAEIGPEDRLRIEMVTGNYFSVLGVEADLGRTLLPADDPPDGPLAAVISDRFWRRRFNASPEVLGTAVSLVHPTFGFGIPATIVGVAEPGFDGADMDRVADLWIPFEGGFGENRNGARVMARLRPGVDLAQVQAEIDLFAGALVERTLAIDRNGEPDVRVEAGGMGYSRLRHAFGRPILALTLGVGLVLVIVWINLGALVLTRGALRRREIAVCVALGGPRSGIVGQFLTEGFILTCGGGLLGLLFASWGTGLLRAYLPAESAFLLEPGLSLSTLVTAAFVSLAGLFLFALVPGIAASGGAPAASLSANASAGRGGTNSLSAQKAIVAAQVAFALFLLVGAGLFLRTLGNLRAVDSGIDERGLFDFRVEGGGSGALELSGSGLGRIAALPGVDSVTFYGTEVRLGDMGERMGASLGPGRQVAIVSFVRAGPAFFETMGISLLAGGDFSDRVDGLVLSESLATYLFGSANPMGRSVFLTGVSAGEPDPDPPDEVRVVGVAEDVRHDSLRTISPHTLYYPSPAAVFGDARFAVRARVDPVALLPAIRGIVAEFGPDLRLADVHSFQEIREATIAPERLAAQLAGFFALAALVLASIGTFGVFSYAATQRRGEIGIRMALGAGRRSVTGMLMRETAWVLVPGIAVGLVAAFVSTRLVSGILFGVSPMDPASVVAAALALTVSAGLAAWLPARRASRLDPMEALRHE